MISSLLSGIASVLTGPSVSMILLLVKATLILLVAIGITLTMQRTSAGARHLVWLVTLAALLLVPGLTAWAPLSLRVLPASISGVSTAPQPGSEPATAVSVPAVSVNPAVVLNAGSANVMPNELAASGSPVLSGLSIIFLVWAAVVLMIAASLGYAAMMVRRIVNRARPLDTEDWLTPLFEVSDRLSLEEPPRLLRSEDAKMPFACGVFDPTIVLPAECDGWSLDRRRAVLLHELAHVRRHDLVGHTLGRLACAIYWFHPLVWTAAKQLRSESERACDDLALACGARATDYAEHLLDIVTSVRGDSTPSVALAMARRKEFEGRMLAILDPELRHVSPSRRQSAALIGSLALISIVVGAAAPAPRAAIVEADSNVSASPSPSIETPKTDVDLGSAQSPRVDLASSQAQQPVPDYPDSVEMAIATKTGLLNKTLAKQTERTVSSVVESVVRGASSSLSSAAILGALKAGTRAQQKDTDERPALLARILATDSSASLRRVAAWGLAEYADTQIAIDALANALRRDPDARVREMAAWALAEGERSATGVQALSAALRGDANVQVRATAAWALGNVGDRSAVEALSAALSDASPQVKTRAVWALGNIDLRQAPPALISLLSDKDPEVRELAAWALYEIEDPASIPALQAALNRESSKELQIAYIRALAALGERSVDALKGLLESRDPEIRSIAVRALAGGHATGPWPRPWPEPRPFPN